MAPDQNLTRRSFLGGAASALGLAGLAGSQDLPAFVDPLAPKPPMFPAKAKNVIFLYMYGGPSQVDTFDYKPDLYPLDGKTIQVKTRGRGGARNEGRVVGPKWSFKQYGECGKWVSELFPNLATQVDRIAFVHSMYADSPIHGSAMLMMNSGHLFSGKPCLGSWVAYGLGSENRDMPGFVVMLDQTGGPISGAKNWSSGYMPATFQGTVVDASRATPILDLAPPPDMPLRVQRRILDRLRIENERHVSERLDNTELAARIASYELAFRMQAAAPNVLNWQSEDPAVHALYGIDRKETFDFGRKCLLARRMVESGVRFVQIYSGGAHNDSNWDAHGDLEHNHNLHAGATDKPIAGLLQDLAQRGLLDETLIVWGGEFGRQPTAEYEQGTGRDHNSYGFTMWLAGGGIKGGVSVGQTDELGAAAVVDRMHVKNLHATILSQLGLDPNALSFRYQGLDQKLVGVEGAMPIPGIA